MQTASRIFHTLAWIAAVFSLCVQLLVVFGIRTGGTDFSVATIVIGSVLLLLSIILMSALRQHKEFAWIPTAASAVLFIVSAIRIADEFSVSVGVTSVGQSLTAWEFVWRHLSPLLVPLFLLGYWFCWRVQQKIEKARKKESTPDSYLNLGDFQLSKLDEE